MHNYINYITSSFQYSQIFCQTMEQNLLTKGFSELFAGIFCYSAYSLLIILLTIVLFSSRIKTGSVWKSKLYLLSIIGIITYLFFKTEAVVNPNNLIFEASGENYFLLVLTKIIGLLILVYFILMQQQEKYEKLNFGYPSIVLIALFGILLIGEPNSLECGAAVATLGKGIFGFNITGLGGTVKNKTPSISSNTANNVSTTANNVSLLNNKENIISEKAKVINHAVSFYPQQLAPSFYRHGAIKYTISPYMVYPNAYTMLDKEIDRLNQLTANTFLKESFITPIADGVQSKINGRLGLSRTENTFDSKANVVSEKDAQQDEITNFMDKLNKGPIISMSTIPKSPYCPKELDEGLYFKGHIAVSYIICSKIGVPMESVMLGASFMFGIPGQNIQALSTLTKLKGLHKPLNMLPYLPLESRGQFTDALLKQFRNLKMQEFTLFFEAMTCSNINRNFNPPFRLNSQQLDKHTANPSVHNNTGQNCPDFVREQKTPSGIIRDYYDQKSSILALKDLNHVRPVTDNVGKMVKKAWEHLSTNLYKWMEIGDNADNPTANTILNKLVSIKKNYDADLDANRFSQDYNSIRNDYSMFFIDNNIPMNLVSEVGIQDFPYDPDHLGFFRAVFLDLYYSASSPVLSFYQKYLLENNGVILDSTKFLQAFGKHYSDFFSEK